MWNVRNPGWSKRTISAIAEASSIASFLLVAAPSVLAIGGAVAALALGHPVAAAFLAGAMSMLVASALALAFPLRSNMRKLVYGWFFAKVVVSLALDADGIGVHLRSVRFAVRIVRAGERGFLDRYCQPGPRLADPDPPAHTPSLVEGLGRVVDLCWDELAQFWVYAVAFPRQDPGAELAFKVKQSLDFRDVPYAPMLQRTILDPTDFLSLRLQMPEACWPVVAYGEQIRRGERTKRLKVDVDEEHREIRLDISKPRLGTAYRIRWTPLHAQPGQLAVAVDDQAV